MNIVGRQFISNITSLKNDDGDWEVTVSMIEKRLVEGKTDWETKELASKCTDTTFNKAYGVAMDATLRKFEDAIALTKTDSVFMENE